MDAVIKVGGSLASYPAVLRAMCAELTKNAERRKLLIVPGGGEFADTVRTADAKFGLNPQVSHKMAVLGMDQFGLLLSNLISRSRVAFSLSVVEGLSGSGHSVILLPSRLVFRARSLPSSWDVTSDSIAAYVAGRLSARKLILVTDVDGVFSANPKSDVRTDLVNEVSASGLKELGARTSVDVFLPTMLLRFGLDCFVVNGCFPERVAQLLAGENAVCTHILSK